MNGIGGEQSKRPGDVLAGSKEVALWLHAIHTLASQGVGADPHAARIGDDAKSTQQLLPNAATDPDPNSFGLG